MQLTFEFLQKLFKLLEFRVFVYLLQNYVLKLCTSKPASRRHRILLSQGLWFYLFTPDSNISEQETTDVGVYFEQSQKSCPNSIILFIEMLYPQWTILFSACLLFFSTFSLIMSHYYAINPCNVNNRLLYQ